MKNKKGFTIVEVIVSFSLSFVIMIYLLNVILLVRNLYYETDLETQMMIKESNLIKQIETKNKNNDISAINSCGENCAQFLYSNGESSELLILPSENKIIFDNLATTFDENVKLENIEVQNIVVANINNTSYNMKDGIIKIRIPIKHQSYGDDYSIEYVYLYNSNYITITGF